MAFGLGLKPTGQVKRLQVSSQTPVKNGAPPKSSESNLEKLFENSPTFVAKKFGEKKTGPEKMCGKSSLVLLFDVFAGIQSVSVFVIYLYVNKLMYIYNAYIYIYVFKVVFSSEDELCV